MLRLSDANRLSYGRADKLHYRKLSSMPTWYLSQQCTIESLQNAKESARLRKFTDMPKSTCALDAYLGT